mgnify:CR=1 FL=1
MNQVADYLEEHKLLLRGGTIMDATLIASPSSTKNKDKKRDPEMSSSKKGRVTGARAVKHNNVWITSFWPTKPNVVSGPGVVPAGRRARPEQKQRAQAGGPLERHVGVQRAQVDGRYPLLGRLQRQQLPARRRPGVAPRPSGPRP